MRLGMRELARHRPDLALGHLRAAVDGTPAACSDELSRGLYWLSVALLRLDKNDLAIKSLASAQKLRRRGVARHAYLKRVNQYGMPRRATPELDDFYAFTSIQMAAYLSRKTRPRFDTAVERDVVLRLVSEAWLRLKQSSVLADMACGSKLELFHKSVPGLSGMGAAIGQAFGQAIGQTLGAALSGAVNLGIAAHAASGYLAKTHVIRADFHRGTTIKADARCICGSGLPYRLCCGRTPSLHEL